MLTRKQLISEYSLTQSDMDTLIRVILRPDINKMIGINPTLLPAQVFYVLVTNVNKYLIIPSRLYKEEYKGVPVPGNSGYYWIEATLTETDKRMYLDKEKLGNGTAWEQGLQINGPESTPEWASFVNDHKYLGIDDPNYKFGTAPCKILPSVILPPPSLRRAQAVLTNSDYGTEEEMWITRCHEERHVIEMSIYPWFYGGGFEEGFPPDNGHEKFVALVKEFKVNPSDTELNEIIYTDIIGHGLMPRSYVGELQAYLGDVIFYYQYFERSIAENMILNDIKAAESIWKQKGSRANLFGIKMAREVYSQSGSMNAVYFLNRLYSMLRF